jgi:FdrA protein
VTNVVRLRRDSYVDSVELLTATRAMQVVEGVTYAAAVMGTPANCDSLAEQGFATEELSRAGANDLVLAVTATSEEEAEGALEAARRSLERDAGGGAAAARDRRAGSADEANVALVSVPGPYAALEAHKALSAGRHVLLFSDNVPLAAEVELKRRAADLGLLLMGPGAGTAILSGVYLGFANAVRRGPVGVVSAAGTGAQEVAALLHRWGSGVSHALGVGGRDLSAEVGGLMTRRALGVLEDDPSTEVLLVVSKPPARAVARALLAQLGPKPTVAALIGLEDDLPARDGVRVARTLEEGARLALEAAGGRAPLDAEVPVRRVDEAVSSLPSGREVVRGLFSGGTLCFEAMVVLSERLGAIHSNTPLRPGWGLPAPTGAHTCLDLGEEEYTRGRPHPMIDPGARAEMLRRLAGDRAIAAVLIDVVLGHGAHADPASVLAPACAEVVAAGASVIAYVLGTDEDPQGYGEQRRRLEDAGCIVDASSGARAALVAAAIAARKPELALASL